MKTPLIVIFILFTLGCRQCPAEGLDVNGLFGQQGSVLTDPTGILLPRGFENIGPQQGYFSEVANNGGYTTDVQGNYAIGVPYAMGGMDQSVSRGIDNARYYLDRIGEFVKNVFIFPFTILKGLAAIPIGILNFLLFPVRIFWSLVKFGFRLFFLPVRIMIGVTKILFYPLKIMLQSLLTPSPPPPPPPYVYGMPAYQSQGLF